MSIIDLLVPEPKIQFSTYYAGGLLSHLRALLLQGLATSRPAIKRSTLAAVLTLALRPVQYAGYSQPLVSSYLLSILSIPGLVAMTKCKFGIPNEFQVEL